LPLNLQDNQDALIVVLDTVDSTNNYAMRLIDADKAQYGLTIVSKEQTDGKGQRGRKWVGEPGDSLMMSLIIQPKYKLDKQSVFNAAVTTAIAEALHVVTGRNDIYIKWPNDMIVNDKKTGGVLIENVIRGANWAYSVIGIGLNVGHPHFPNDLPQATSLFREFGELFHIEDILHIIRTKILQKLELNEDVQEVMDGYNRYLYKRDAIQTFTDATTEWSVVIKQVNNDGTLRVMNADGTIANYTHGSVTWKW
jgi:BirA family biotin operon repressor/biotin-[acetyl-CoA-carboxylase] ligase